MTNTQKHIVSFLLGVIVGGIVTFATVSKTTLDQQAALGGAVIPFQSGMPLPSPSTGLPNNLIAEPSDSSSMNISEPLSLANQQADVGQTKSTRLFRPLIRRTR